MNKESNNFNFRVRCQISGPSGLFGVYGSSAYDKTWSGTSYTDNSVPNNSQVAIEYPMTYGSYTFSHITGTSGINWTYHNGYATATLTKDGAFTVVYAAATKYNITVTASTGGSVSGGGQYTEGDTATIRATPNRGYDFDYWEDDRGYRYSTNPYSFTVDRDRTFVAHFKTKTLYHVAVTAGTGGTVTGAGDYYDGEQVIITASAYSGYDFDYWEDERGYQYSQRTYSFAINSNRTFVAHFKVIPTYKIIVTATTGGNVSGGGTYPEGAPANIYAYPFEDYDFDYWEDDRGYRYSDNPHTIAAVTENKTFVAHFISQTTYLVTTSGDPGCHTTGGGRYVRHKYCTVRCTLDPGYVFDGWYIGTTLKSNELNYYFAVEGNTTLYAKCHWEGAYYPRKSAYLSGNYDQYFLNYDWYNYSYPGHPFTYPIPNCTTYAYARTMEICQQIGVLNWYTLVGTNNPVWFTGQCTFPNATDWFYETMHNGWTKANAEFGTPQVGAIVCFVQGSSRWPGHVAVVEETDGTLAGTYLSYSGYEGQAFYYKNMIDVINEYQGYGMTFVGYLYNPFIGQQPGPTPGTTYTITLHASPTAGGTVHGAGTFEAFTYRYIHATPADGYRFVRWSDNDKTNEREIFLNGDITLTAYFKEIKKLNPGILYSIINKKKGTQNVKIIK